MICKWSDLSFIEGRHSLKDRFSDKAEGINWVVGTRKLYDVCTFGRGETQL